MNDELAVVVVADAPAPVLIEGSEQGCLVEMRAVQVGGGGGALQSEDKEKEGRRVSREAELRTHVSIVRQRPGPRWERQTTFARGLTSPRHLRMRVIRRELCGLDSRLWNRRR